MTFQLDTTGHFHRPKGSAVNGNPADTILTWDDLSPFTQGYIEALLEGLNDKRIDALGGHHGPAFRFYVPAKFSDLAPETLARIIADCEAAKVIQNGWTPLYRKTRAGGPCFWSDRQAGRLPAFPPLTVQLGDDGKVRFA